MAHVFQTKQMLLNIYVCLHGIVYTDTYVSVCMYTHTYIQIHTQALTHRYNIFCIYYIVTLHCMKGEQSILLLLLLSLLL